MDTQHAIAQLTATATVLGSDILTLTERVLTYPGFTTWSGSVNNRHHYGEGGLVRHTAEVANLCMYHAGLATEWGHDVDGRVLWLAAVTHDWGKVFDYDLDPAVKAGIPVMPSHQWVKTPHHRLIHHVQRSALLWSAAVAETGLCRAEEDAVLHCILSHHGAPEYGSVIKPRTREAWILHLADNLSARLDDCDRAELR